MGIFSCSHFALLYGIKKTHLFGEKRREGAEFMGKGPTRSMIRRSTVMLAIFAIALLIWLAGRLVQYQIVDYSYYQTKAITQQTMDATLYAHRGSCADSLSFAQFPR